MISLFLCAKKEIKVNQLSEEMNIDQLQCLDERIVRAIKDMGFEKLSPIQQQAIPYVL